MHIDKTHTCIYASQHTHTHQTATWLYISCNGPHEDEDEQQTNSMLLFLLQIHFMLHAPQKG